MQEMSVIYNVGEGGGKTARGHNVQHSSVCSATKEQLAANIKHLRTALNGNNADFCKKYQDMLLSVSKSLFFALFVQPSSSFYLHLID